MANPASSKDGEWGPHKELLKTLYLTEDMPKKDIRTLMKEKYAFDKSEKQYTYQFGKWGFQKNLKKNTSDEVYKFIHYRIQKRKREGKDDSEVYVGRKKLSTEKIRKEISRHTRLDWAPRLENIPGSPATPPGVSVCTPCTVNDLVLPRYFRLPTLPGHEFEDWLMSQRFQRRTPAGGGWSPTTDHAFLSPNIGAIRESIFQFAPPLSFSDGFLFELPDSWEQTEWPKSQALLPPDTDPVAPLLAMGNESLVQTTTLGRGSVTEEFLHEARMLLPHDDTFDLERTRPALARSAPHTRLFSHLKPVIIERREGDLATNLDITKSSLHHVILRLLAHCVHLSSNNLLSGHESDGLLKWICKHKQQWLLDNMLRSSLMTVRVFASHLLVSAARLGEVDVATMLIRHGINLNTQSDGVSALLAALHEENVAIVELLLNHGADPNMSCTESWGNPPLHVAIRDKEVGTDLVRLLLEAGANPSTQFDDQIPPLLLAVRERSAEIVHLLLKAKADPNSQAQRWTALQEACRVITPEIVQLLVDAGAEVNAQREYMISKHVLAHHLSLNAAMGMTPIQIAADNNDLIAVQILLAAGAQPDLIPIDLRKESHLAFFSAVCCNERSTCVRSALQLAVSNDNMPMAEILLKAGSSVDIRDVGSFGDTPLQIAVIRGNESMVLFLLQAGANINALVGESGGRTALQAAAGTGNFPLFNTLLERGADINAPAGIEYGLTVLQAAAWGGHIEMVRRLLSVGAFVNDAPGLVRGRTALQAAAGCQSNRSELIKILLKAGADVNAEGAVHAGFTALQAACLGDDIEAVQVLLEAGADVNAPPHYGGATALQAAVSKGTMEITRLLLEFGADVNAAATAPDGMTALQTAVKNGKLQLVELLLDHRADPNAPRVSIQGPRALEMATEPDWRDAEKPESFDADIVTRLLAAGADINARCRSGATAIHVAIRAACEFKASKLLNELLQLLRPDDKPPETALYPAIDAGDVEVLKSLIRAGADTNGGALAYAAKRQNLEMVRTLLQNGADVNCSGENDPESALNSAIEVGNIQIFEFLIAAGADVNFAAESLEYGRTTPLQLGVQTGHPDMVHTLLLHGADANAPATIRSEKTALQAAAEDGDVEMVHQFLSLGADVNAPAAGGGRRTALQWAAQEGHVEMFHCLLSAGADVNAAPALGGGVTALQAAAIGGYGGIVVDLLKAGATVESPGAKFDGRNAIEAAAEHGRLDILCLLLDAHEDGELLQKTLEQAAELAEDEDHVVIAQFLREYKKA